MFSKSFDIKQLYIFVTVVKCGGLSAAQDYLNMALPTVSGHIKMLEDKVGIQLCTRGRSGFKLTEDGEEFYEKAVLLVNNFKDFSDFAQSLQSDLHGNLKIGFTAQSLRDFPVSEAFEQYYGRENSVVLKFRSHNDHELHRMVAESEIDVAIGVGDPRILSPNLSGLEFHPIFEETHFVYCGDKHELYEKAQIKKSDLVDQRHYIRLCGSEDSSLLGSTNIGAEIDDASTALALLLSGKFIGYFPAQIAKPWVESKLLKPIILTELKDTFSVGYVKKTSTRSSTNLNAFLEDLETCFEEYRKTIESGRFDTITQSRHRLVY